MLNWLPIINSSRLMRGASFLLSYAPRLCILNIALNDITATHMETTMGDSLVIEVSYLHVSNDIAPEIAYLKSAGRWLDKHYVFGLLVPDHSSCCRDMYVRDCGDGSLFSDHKMILRHFDVYGCSCDGLSPHMLINHEHLKILQERADDIILNRPKPRIHHILESDDGR